ncbi:MAG: CubicO group peptidase (beta-lactamase class C family) [Arenicella sp.]
MGYFSGSIQVVRNDSVFFRKNHGLADYENKKGFSELTAFKVGELSELYVKSILERFIAENRLEVNQLASKYLPK